MDIYQILSQNIKKEKNSFLRTENPRVGGSILPLGIHAFSKSADFLFASVFCFV
jgi:hypothetical protein